MFNLGNMGCIEVCNKIAPPLAHVPCIAPYLCQRDAILLPLLNSSSNFFLSMSLLDASRNYYFTASTMLTPLLVVLC